MKGNWKTIFGVLGVVLSLCVSPTVNALTIIPAFDSTITSDPNAAAIEATINTAIQLYETRFSDPITVTILFQEISTSGLYGHSSWYYYNISYSTYINRLSSDATTSYDAKALARLPTASTNPVTGTTLIRVKTANLKAIGITGDPSGLTNGYDGIIGLHVSQLNITRPDTNPNRGDLLATVEHEMDEILGLSSSLDSGNSNPLPQDLFRYTLEGARTFTTAGDDAYFSLDGTNFLARFNQVSGDDYGDWWFSGPHTAQVQDASATNGKMPNPQTELIALDVIGYNLLPAPIPVITHESITNTQLTLQVSNGMAGGTYILLAGTNVTTPVAQWTPLATNYQGTNGNFSMIVNNAVNASFPRRFFRVVLE